MSGVTVASKLSTVRGSSGPKRRQGTRGNGKARSSSAGVRDRPSDRPAGAGRQRPQWDVSEVEEIRVAL